MEREDLIVTPHLLASNFGRPRLEGLPIAAAGLSNTSLGRNRRYPQRGAMPVLAGNLSAAPFAELA
jgi:hypothetical protein